MLVPLELNDTFEIVDLDAVEELIPLSSPDDLTSKSQPLDDAQKTPMMIRYSDYVLRVIT